MNQIQKLALERKSDGSGAFCMHANAILSCAVVIRQPQLITCASNIYASRKPRFIYKHTAIYHVLLSHWITSPVRWTFSANDKHEKIFRVKNVQIYCCWLCYCEKLKLTVNVFKIYVIIIKSIILYIFTIIFN